MRLCYCSSRRRHMTCGRHWSSAVCYSDLWPAAPPAALSIEDQVLFGLEHGPVGPALERLSPELRAVLQATVLDGLTTREAAQIGRASRREAVRSRGGVGGGNVAA